MRKYKSYAVKHLFPIILCGFLALPGISHAQEMNEAIEPAVTGPQALDLLESGTLDAWRIPSDRWHLEDGVIVGSTGSVELETPEWLYTKQSFSDFEFTCELRLTGDNHRNTGIYYRVNTIQFKGHWDEEDEEDLEEMKDWEGFEAPSGYEMDAAYQEPGEEDYTGSLGDWYKRPSLRIFVDQSIIKHAFKADDWNRMTLRAKGNRLEYWINGIKVMDYIDPDPKGSKEGIIGFQIHDGAVMKVEYRNVRVLPL